MESLLRRLEACSVSQSATPGERFTNALYRFTAEVAAYKRTGVLTPDLISELRVARSRYTDLYCHYLSEHKKGNIEPEDYDECITDIGEMLRHWVTYTSHEQIKKVAAFDKYLRTHYLS